MRTLLCWLVYAAVAAGPAPAAPTQAAAPAPAPGLSAEHAALLEKIQAKYAPVTVLKAKFVQTTGSPLYGEDRQEGTLTLQRPGKMRWTFGDGREFVCDGQTMWIYTPADKQVLKLGDIGEQAATADAVLQSMHRLRELFDVTVVRSDAAGHELSLAPKAGEDAQFKKLQLGLGPDLVLRQVRVTDAFDSVTTMDFTAVELGGTVAPDVFTFVVPKGVKVIGG